MKRKKTETASESLEVCPPISEVKKRKKKKKDVNEDSTNTVDVTDECTNEDLNGKKKSETCESVSGVKKNKKMKKDKDVRVKTTESSELKNEELNGKKKETHKTKSLEVCVPISEVKKRKKKKKDVNGDSINTVDVTDECTDEDLNGKKKSEVCESVSGVKKNKKTKKDKDVHVDTTESSDLKNEELNGKKKETHETKQPVITEKDSVEEEEGMEDEDEELSPEERRVLERKLKKIRKKEEKKKQKQETKAEKEESKSSIAQTQALEYLTCWSEKRDEWKFQKTRQVWLLQHMYDSAKVSDAHFSVLLSYLEGLKGVAREMTVHKAEALVRFGAGPGEEGGAAEAQKKTQRAREVIQILS